MYHGAKLCDMPVPLVLVHSPLVGPVTWDAVAGAAQQRGYEVLIPDLTGAVADGPPYWPGQVRQLGGWCRVPRCRDAAVRRGNATAG